MQPVPPLSATLDISLAGAATSIILVATNKQASFYRDRKRVLSRQTKTFVCDQNISNKYFVATKVLSQQAYFCRDKHIKNDTSGRCGDNVAFAKASPYLLGFNKLPASVSQPKSDNGLVQASSLM